MHNELLNIKQKLVLLERQMNINSVASNFVIRHLVDILTEKLPNENIIGTLQEKLEHDIGRINISGTRDVKKAINNLLQTPVQEVFKQKESPFIK
ncbi:hypothetical protein MC862_003521 [Proteus mirabilis]|nr:hypothetical protein [Proteus mirabilis]